MSKVLTNRQRILELMQKVKKPMNAQVIANYLGIGTQNVYSNIKSLQEEYPTKFHKLVEGTTVKYYFGDQLAPKKKTKAVPFDVPEELFRGWHDPITNRTGACLGLRPYQGFSLL